MVTYGTGTKSVLRHLLLTSALLATAFVTVGAAETTDELGVAVRAAAAAVNPSVVRLRVIGGERTVDGEKVTSLVTTGLVVSENGEILTSQFAVQGNPEAVLIETMSGKRTSATIVATDHLRRLVLLKAKDGEWTPATAASPETVHVGQYSVAVGRFYSGSSSSLSVGIVSAVNRIHGLAIQTDAKVSPVNYGGPLTDLHGKVLGVLVPLSPNGQGNANAGIEWYDSGIGFAIPLSDAMKAVERLREGNDLRPGKLGLRLTAAGLYSDRILVDEVVRGGPAQIAGLKKGDRLRKVNGTVIERMGILEEAVSSRYAGDRLVLELERSTELLTLDMTLVEEMPEFKPGWLGLMTVRAKTGPAPNAIAAKLLQGMQKLKGDPEDSPEPAEEPVEDASEADAKAANTPDSVSLLTLNGSPAAQAKLPAVLELVSLSGAKTSSPLELNQAVRNLQADMEVDLEYRVPGASEVLQVKLNAIAIPEQLPEIPSGVLEAMQRVAADSAVVETTAEADPAAVPPDDQKEQENLRTTDGITRREWPFEDRGQCVSLSSSESGLILPGIIILLSGGTESEDALLQQWKPYLKSHALTLAIPVNPEKSLLTPDDLPLVMTSLQALASGGRADLRRLVVVGSREQVPLVWQLLFGGPSPIRSAVLTEGWFAGSDAESVEGQGHSILYLDPAGSRESSALLNESLLTLRNRGFRVFRPADDSVEQSIADLSLLLRSF
jgi:S1-C subfamily serine protease